MLRMSAHGVVCGLVRRRGIAACFAYMEVWRVLRCKGAMGMVRWRRCHTECWLGDLCVSAAEVGEASSLTSTLSVLPAGLTF